MNYVDPQNKAHDLNRDPSSEKMILKNTKTIVSTIKTLEYKVSILENILRSILEEIRECRRNEM